jgi:carbamoyl-phosphate synthase small subunit
MTLAPLLPPKSQECDLRSLHAGSRNNATLLLEDGLAFSGHSFGFESSSSGEVVFNTGMVGYPEAFTDPSYRGQILVLTYPLIGNYGVGRYGATDGFANGFESDRLQIAGLIVSQVSERYSHWGAQRSVAEWLTEEQVPAITGVDTRALTKCLRERGTMMGRIVIGGGEQAFWKPNTNTENLVSRVSVQEKSIHGAGHKTVLLVDCGCKNSIQTELLQRGATVVRVPWDYDFRGEKHDGIVISNGPGDPKLCNQTIQHVKYALEGGTPILGICLGHQILALAAGADTYKMKFGHRSQNQPCIEVGTKRCYITSQNHGYAVIQETLPDGWLPWFINANDRTNEGIRHRTKPFYSVQFHPEAAPGPVDTAFLFSEFLNTL